MPVEAAASRGPRFHRHSDLPAQAWLLADGTRLTWRPVQPQDHALLDRFIARLSRRTRFERFFAALDAPSPTLLAQMTQVDFRHHQAFVVTHGAGPEETMVADARFVVDGDADAGDLALVVGDPWQHQGIGTQVLHLLAEAAACRGLRWLRCDVRQDNQRMLRLMKRCGFFHSPHPDDEGMVQGIKLLLPPYPRSPCADSAPVPSPN